MMFWFGNEVSGWGYQTMTVSMLAFWGLLPSGAIRSRSGADPSMRAPVQAC